MDLQITELDPQALPLHDMTCMLSLSGQYNNKLPEPITLFEPDQHKNIEFDTGEQSVKKTLYQPTGASGVCDLHLESGKEKNALSEQNTCTPFLVSKITAEERAAFTCWGWNNLNMPGRVIWTTVVRRHKINLVTGYKHTAVDYRFIKARRKGLIFLPQSSTSTIRHVSSGGYCVSWSIDNMINGSLYYGYREIDFKNSKSRTTQEFMYNRRKLCDNPIPGVINPFSINPKTNEPFRATAFVWVRKDLSLEIHSADAARGYACKLMQNYMLSSDDTPFRRLERDIKRGLSINICGYNLQNIPDYKDDDDVGSMLRACYDNPDFNFSSEVVLYVMLTYPADLWPWANITIN